MGETVLKLCGFAASNYYNKVKLALLEKGLPFEEVLTYPSATDAFLAESPMGKVPLLKTEHGALSESQAVLEYLEDTFPAPPLYPAEPFERAKCRELIQVMELYVELPARRLYGAAHFGGSASEELKREVQAQLGKGLRALGLLARVGPFIMGGRFSAADCAALVHLPLVSATCKIVFGEDPLTPFPEVQACLARAGERPSARQVNADRKAAMPIFIDYRAKLAAAAKNGAARSG